MAKAIVFVIESIISDNFQEYKAVFGTATISKTDVIVGDYIIPIYNVKNILNTETEPDKNWVLILE